MASTSNLLAGLLSDPIFQSDAPASTPSRPELGAEVDALHGFPSSAQLSDLPSFNSIVTHLPTTTSSSNNTPVARRTAAQQPFFDPSSPFVDTTTPSQRSTLKKSKGLRARLEGIGGDGGFLLSPATLVPDSPMDSHAQAGMKIYARTRESLSAPKMERSGGLVPYPERLPTQTLGRGKNARDIDDTALDSDSLLETLSDLESTPQALERRKTMKKGMSATRNRGPLVPLSIDVPPLTSSFAGLLTPISGRVPSFFDGEGDLNAPFNTPTTAIRNSKQDVLPQEYGVLANHINLMDVFERYGLSVADQSSPAHNVLGPDSMTFNGGMLHPSVGQQIEFAHGLPTPALLPSSGFTSPATSCWSGRSPPGTPVRRHQLDLYSTMLESNVSRSSMRSDGSSSVVDYLLGEGSSASACDDQASTDNDAFDPSLLVGTSSAQSQFDASLFVGATAPSNNASMACQTFPSHVRNGWPNATDATSTNESALLQNFGQLNGLGFQNDSLSSQLQVLEDMESDIRSALCSPHNGSKKRARGDENEEEERYAEDVDDDEDDSGDYAPGRHQDSQPAKRKRVENTSSAALRHPPVGKRLKPGPRPKKGKGAAREQEDPLDALDSLLNDTFRPSASPSIAAEEEEQAQVEAQALTKELINTMYRTVASPDEVTPTGRPQKMYICIVGGCNRPFPRKSAVESHIQSHYDLKPFKCTFPECTSTFVRKHDLRRHERIHSDKKPFSCPCGRQFARGDALSRHQQRGICEGSVIPRRC